MSTHPAEIADQLASSAKQAPHMPITPPHSSRSAFAELPLTQKFKSAPQLSGQTTEELGSDDGMEEEDQDDGEYDDEDECEDREEESFTQPGLGLTPGYDGLGGPVTPEAFTAEDELFGLIEPGHLREAEAALSELTGSISSALTQYRDQFDAWEQLPNPPVSVIRASLLIDQGLARFIFVLEPFKLNATQFHALSGDFNELSSFITQNHLDQHNPTTTTTTNTQLWNGLGRLADEIVQVEDGLSCAMAEISELHDWVDGLLTPALAEVKFSYRATNELVSKILDVHSYLCDSLAKAASILAIYRSVLGHLSRAIDSLQAALLDHLEPSNPLFPFPQTAAWAAAASLSLASFARAIAIFCSISSCIQLHTQGALVSDTPPIGSTAHPPVRFYHAISN
ncbi:hypothetical protein PGTUg99_002148 [Puccinia graminis f. sp. tritici]|uniref:Uncharacterized protein n=1 Tax=Puccinia graminis f. sp. tritici TaxID=56615 RepID=A0A5B0LK33_PUCGR|nr:hypothetical protein PGTUg99_002148 [Puccinia graminis f. sp. tritici]